MTNLREWRAVPAFCTSVVQPPESNVFGLALLSVVATWSKGTSFDPASIGIVAAASDDLVSHGFDRSEIELVFKRFRKNLYVAPDVAALNDVY